METYTVSMEDIGDLHQPFNMELSWDEVRTSS